MAEAQTIDQQSSTCTSETESEKREQDPTEAKTKETMEASGSTDMNQFYQRMKSDLMYELRSIQHGEKPVTGQNHREHIQKFMEKYVSADDNQETSGSSNSANVDEHRPEAVVVEVQGVIEQRRVSSVLQSAAFRRQLENVIRGSIQSTQRRASPVPRPRNIRSTNNVVSAVAPSTQQRGPTLSAHAVIREESLLPMQPRLTRHDSTDSISSVDSFSSARSSVEDDFDDEVDTSPTPSAATHEAQREQTHERQQATNRTAFEQRALLQEEINRRVNRHEDVDTGLPNLSWNEISHVQRQELVEDISELLHSRLVSNTLDGEFRATLELLVQDRVAGSGTNGQAVQDIISSLPRGGVVRNDFTHLGIPAQDMDNLDNISVTSVSAHSVPYTQTNTHLSREIQSLKSQMAEMKNMLKLTFDLQMDIQRAVRQEVSAAMHSVTAQGATAAPLRPSVPVNDTHCIICLDKHSDSVLYQCGHMCVCYFCGKDLVSRNLGCPVCRAPIKDVIRAYKTNSE